MAEQYSHGDSEHYPVGARYCRFSLQLVVLVAAVCLLACGNDGGTADTQADITGPTLGGKEDNANLGWLGNELIAWNAWLSEADRATKWERMAASPYAFFRGTNHLFWTRFHADPRLAFYGDETTVT